MVTSAETRPIIRYIGGKYSYGKIFDQDNLIPKTFNNYHEPFVGGGGMFCYVNGTRIVKRNYINDRDSMLINLYKEVKKNPEKIIKKMETIPVTKNVFETCKRKLQAHACQTEFENSVCYLYLKTYSFNGMIRKNFQTYFSLSSALFNGERLIAFSTLLQKSFIKNVDYIQTLKNIEKDDFVFIDPPYFIPDIKGYYYHHHITLLELLDYCDNVTKKGAKFLLTLNYEKNIAKSFNLKGYTMKKLYTKNTHSPNATGKLKEEMTIINF